ncbi:MAG: isoprenylcysteine carboxylmethyltransferase family protein [Spirochaetales bacterium]|nr:isoprenylcysteine carboxylmethyltransferase family protein [Spirochaetales bacterium]
MAKKHEHRKDLAGEHALTDIGQLIGIVVFLAVWIIDSFFLKYSVFLSSVIPAAVRIPIAAALIVAAGVMAWISHRIIFVERRDPPVVITKSFFKYIRHPLYLSEILLYLGLFFLTCSLLALAIITVICVFLNYVAGAEEKLLEKAFGRRYLDYKRATGKWLPNLRRLFSKAQAAGL